MPSQPVATSQRGVVERATFDSPLTLEAPALPEISSEAASIKTSSPVGEAPAAKKADDELTHKSVLDFDN